MHFELCLTCFAMTMPQTCHPHLSVLNASETFCSCCTCSTLDVHAHTDARQRPCLVWIECAPQRHRRARAISTSQAQHVRDRVACVMHAARQRPCKHTPTHVRDRATHALRCTRRVTCMPRCHATTWKGASHLSRCRRRSCTRANPGNGVLGDECPPTGPEVVGSKKNSESSQRPTPVCELFVRGAPPCGEQHT
jgi:hypothetical protein